MPGLVPGIHDFSSRVPAKMWMAGTSPAMTGKAMTGDDISLTCGYGFRTL
jgi:hypothetical protein